MRRLDLLIDEARRESDNTSYSDDSGIQQSEFIRWANSAQRRLSTLINQAFPNVFLKEKLLTAENGVEEITIPSDVFYGSRIKQVDYSRTGNTNDYYKLKEGTLPERLNSLKATPSFYIRRGNSLLIQPPPDSTGIFRVNYQKKFRKIDIRRATVSAVTLDTGNRTITSLTLDTSVFNDFETIQNEGYLCIVDKDGVAQMSAIPVASIDPGTGVVTLDGSFTYEEGETIAVGDYAVSGPYSTTHSELNDEAETYLVDFMIWKASKRDSSDDSVEQNAELKEMEDDIVKTYSAPSADVNYVPMIDTGAGNFDIY